jgi:hypothetical protein
VPGSRKAASYVAKYVAKSVDSRQLVPWLRTKLDRQTGELSECSKATYRAWSSSRTWPVRMRELVEASRSALQIAPVPIAEKIGPIGTRIDPVAIASGTRIEPVPIASG